MKIDKVNDEFIVDCTNNSKEERQQVYKFLVDNRNYQKSYLEEDYPVIVCNKKQNYSNWDSLEKYYTWVNSKKDISIYTFEKFEEMYLTKTYTIQKLRNAPIQIKVYSEEQAIKLAYAVGYDKDWKPYNAKYPIYCYLNEYNFPSWSYSEKERKDKPTIIKFNQIENFMESKKIIGYKLIKEYPNSKQLGYEEPYTTGKLSEYPEFWQPIYEEEYKVGDWITITEVDSPGWLNDTKQRTFQIENNPTSFKGGIYWRINGGKALHAKFRKATPEEIKNTQKTIVNMHSSNKGEFEIEVVDGKAYYRPENKHLPKKWIKDIINTFGEQGGINYPYKIEVESVKVGCMKGTRKEDWENVYKLLK